MQLIRQYNILLIALCLFLIGCLSGNLRDTDTIKKEKEISDTSLKGFELYSWETNSIWQFALLTGTNRLRSKQEIIDPELNSNIYQSKEIINRIDQLPANSEIFWLFRTAEQNDQFFTLPDEKIYGEIKELCDQKGINLHVTN